MVNQLSIILLVILTCEFLRFVKIIQLVKNNIKIYKKIIKLFNLKKISDHWKEKAILNYSKNLFLVSLKIISILIIISIFVLILDVVNKGFTVFLFSTFGIIEMFVIFYGYTKFRKINGKL
tara:strand:+ start:7583 stop:7945 length:363 start_codon:yes stop_codon:yes gene_type:complete